MRKVRLKVQELTVESFVSAPSSAVTRGTVWGRVTADPGGECATLGMDPTCQFFASCDPRVECEGTVYESTCRVNDC
jgi:hypothetical protein